MNKLKLKGEWNEIKGKLKEKYSELTDVDVTYTKAKKINYWDNFKRLSVRQKTKSAK
jgi:hypothetical protein